MISTIAKVVATAVVAEVIVLLRPEVEKLVAEASTRLKKLADDALIEAFKALDRNGDGTININDLFR